MHLDAVLGSGVLPALNFVREGCESAHVVCRYLCPSVIMGVRINSCLRPLAFFVRVYGRSAVVCDSQWASRSSDLLQVIS